MSSPALPTRMAYDFGDQLVATPQTLGQASSKVTLFVRDGGVAEAIVLPTQ